MSSQSGWRARGVSGECVVVAEDEKDLRDAIAELLMEAGWSVVEVSTVAELRAVLSELEPVAITLDVNLADDSSETVLAELTTQRRPIAVVLVTACAEAPSIANRYGVELVKKPFDVDDLTTALARARQRVTAA